MAGSAALCLRNAAIQAGDATDTTPRTVAAFLYFQNHAEEIFAMLTNREDLNSVMKEAFAKGARWPIDRPSLRALSHMGLSIEQIARYFSVDDVEVEALLDHGK